MPRFSGWPPAAVDWFAGLEEDNSKGYWQANLATYEDSVRGPMEALLDEVADEFGEGKVFRPYRDVRFSRDKSPYKTHTGAVIQREPAGVYYVQVSADGLLAAAGYHQMAADQLERFRAAIDGDRSGQQLAAITDGLARAGYGWHGETLKTAPRGYPKDHPRIDLLRRKSLVLTAEVPPNRTLHTRRALTHVASTWREAADLLAWLDRHVGAPR